MQGLVKVIVVTHKKLNKRDRMAINRFVSDAEERLRRILCDEAMDHQDSQ